MLFSASIAMYLASSLPTYEEIGTTRLSSENFKVSCQSEWQSR